MNWMSILGLCLILAGTAFSFFGTQKADSESQKELTNQINLKNKTIDEINAANVKLVDQNSRLLLATEKVGESNTELTNQNKEILKSSLSTYNMNNDLVLQNKEMISKIGNYQDDIEKKNKIIEQLQNDVVGIKKYADVAALDQFGQDVVVMPPLKSTKNAELISLMKKLYRQEGENLYVISDLSNAPIAQEVIEKYPTFPFSYYVLSLIYKSNDSNAYIKYADKAIEIFKITTTISGHHPSHDQALQYLLDYIKQK